MSLPLLVNDDNWQSFDLAWQELIASGGPIDELLDALGSVAEKRRMPRCLPILKEHAERLAKDERASDAAELLGAGVRGGGSPSELAAPLVECAQQAWGTEPWFDSYSQLCGLVLGMSDARRAWEEFSKLRSFAEGTIIFHRSGWGLGEVKELFPDDLEVHIRFQSGREDRFPMKTAVEIFEIVDDEDLRAQAYRDSDALKKRIKAEPLEILTAVLNAHGGKATTVTIRNALLAVGVTGNSWTSWWRKCRLLAENSEWYRVSGSGQKAEVRILKQAADPVEGTRRQLRNSTTLQSALQRVRDLLVGGKIDPEVEKAALEVLLELSLDDSHPMSERLPVWMLLRDRAGETPEPLRTVFEEAKVAELPADPSTPPPVWALIQEFPGAREQEKCVELLREIYGEEAWLDEASNNLQFAPAGMVKSLVDKLFNAGRGDDLAAHYSTLLARPLRAPAVLIALGNVVESGKVEGDFPTPVQRAQALIELAVYLNEYKRGNAVLQRVHQRLVDLLCKGDPALLRRLFKGSNAATMRTALTSIQRGVDDQIDSVITDIAVEIAPEIFRSAERAFWEEEAVIWTTIAGRTRREAELTELRNVKIPENREAIARAASYGDLSENAEWEQAIEDQRQLTEQASRIESELRQVSLIGNAPIQEDTVSPGTEVEYKEIESGAKRKIVLLGPWDDEIKNAVSYRAPLAQGMLGLQPGDRAPITLPSGTVEVEVLSVKVLEVD